MDVTTAAKARVGRSSGRVTRRNSCQAPAPSILAASWTSRGTPWSPARKITITKPRLRQAAIAMIAGIARSGEPSQFGPPSPTHRSARFTRPTSGVQQEAPHDRDGDDAHDRRGVIAGAHEGLEARQRRVEADRDREPQAERERHPDQHEVGGVLGPGDEGLVVDELPVVFEPDEPGRGRVDDVAEA